MVYNSFCTTPFLHTFGIQPPSILSFSPPYTITHLSSYTITHRLDGSVSAISHHHSHSTPSSSSSSSTGRGFWGGYHVVRPAMIQALTTSFGSICLGSLAGNGLYPIPFLKHSYLPPLSTLFIISHFPPLSPLSLTLPPCTPPLSPFPSRLFPPSSPFLPPFTYSPLSPPSSMYQWHFYEYYEQSSITLQKNYVGRVPVQVASEPQEGHCVFVHWLVWKQHCDGLKQVYSNDKTC